MVKIGLVGHSIPGSIGGVSMGIDKMFYNLAREFDLLGHETSLFVRDDVSASDEFIRKVRSTKVSWIPYMFSMRNALQKEDFDIYHSDYATTGAAVKLARKIPSLVTLHDAIPFKFNSGGVKDIIINKWFKYCFSLCKDADGILVRSNYAKRDLIEQTKLNEKNIFVVSSGVDTDFFKPLGLNRNGAKIRIGYLGGLDGRKNVKLLVDTFSDIVKTRSDIELHVGGTGKSLKEFNSLGIPNAVFHGSVTDDKLNEFYNGVDLFVYPTLDEGLGMPVLEAMSAGVPVLAANTCSMPELVGDVGKLFEPDRESLKQAILNIVDGPDVLEKMSVDGREKSERMDWSTCANDVMNIYKLLMNR